MARTVLHEIECIPKLALMHSEIGRTIDRWID